MVCRQSGVGTPFPMLTKTNYHEWSLLMKVKMQARQLWDAVAVGVVDFHNDRWVLEALCAATPPELGASLADKATAKLGWESVATARISGNRIRHATLQRLRQDWEALAFLPGEQIEDFALQLSNLMQQMARDRNEDLTEARAVEKLLHCMPKYT